MTRRETEDFDVDDYAYVCRLLRANGFTQPTLREQALAAVNEIARLRASADEETALPRDPASVRVGERVECRPYGGLLRSLSIVVNVWEPNEAPHRIYVQQAADAISVSYDAELQRPFTWRFLPADYPEAGEQ